MDKLFNTTKCSGWEEVFSNSSQITVKTLKTGTIVSKISGLINLKNPGAKGLKGGRAKVPVLNHLVNHSQYGYFLIDTGLDSLAHKSPGGSFKGIIKSIYFRNRYIVGAEEGIDYQLESLGINPKRVFLTHAHEHLAGLDSLPDDIEIICGKGEVDTNFRPLVYSDYFKRYNFKTVDFNNAVKMPILGKAIDIFGDGSFWAVATPGHTNGHISYLINGSEKLLVIGDVCSTEKGFLLGVESGLTKNMMP